MPKTFDREDVLAADEELDDKQDSQAEDVASASEDENQPKPVKAKAQASEAPDGDEEAENGDKPDPEAGKPEAPVDWEQVAKRERWKRQRKNDELEALQRKVQELEGKAGRHPEGQSHNPPSRTGEEAKALRKPQRGDPEILYDDEKYDAAMDQYIQSLVDSKIQGIETKIEQKARLKQENEKRQGYGEKLADYAARNPDFEKRYVEAGKPQLPPHVDEFLVDSELGPEIENELYGDLDALSKVLKSSPMEASRLLARIEARIASSSQSPTDASGKPKPITKAPKPISDPVPKPAGGRPVGLMKGFHFAT